MIYSKKLKRSKKWRDAFEKYESVCGFEPMHQDDIDAGKMTMREAWRSNVSWLEDVLATVTNIETPIE